MSVDEEEFNLVAEEANNAQEGNEVEAHATEAAEAFDAAEAAEGEFEEDVEEAAADDNGGEQHFDGAETAFSGVYSPEVVNESVFELLDLGADTAQEVQATWAALLRSAESREAAGEAIYGALFDAAPSLQSLFKTPRAVMAMRFMNGLQQIIGSLGDPKGLKIVVETLGFQHLDLEVTVPRVVIFRDAICDLVSMELGAQFTDRAQIGWATFLNYVGGSYIFIRKTFTDRLKILNYSWKIASGSKDEVLEEEEAAEDEENQKSSMEKQVSKTKTSATTGGKEEEGERPESGETDFGNTAVPTSYNDMFMFNAAVMGFRNSQWMVEVLASFDAIVTNVSNSYRLQEECDVLSLRMSKFKGAINLPEYKAVMLASLRSLVPKDWSPDYEVAWSWLWENVERMLKSLLGKPLTQERALAKLWASLDEAAQAFVRREVYAKFFALSPSGQDYFKQSTTRLHFIADKIVDMTLDMYKEPKRMTEDISALGLRHVGYGIPTDQFGAFVSACVEVVRSLTTDDDAVDAFRWSLSLISRMLTRVINEGSTIVMKAINNNSAKQLRKAIACAPRSKRALWMLNVQVGTQSISPLLWAIETGSLESAKAIIVDLLTIRADRDRYYYGMDTMFERHPDLVRIICADARGLLPTLLDGLIWRSRITENGMRRVNYYVRHLLVDEEGEFSKTVEWITESHDPVIVCHPIFVLILDLLWNRVTYRTFLFDKLWFLLTLLIFVCSQSILNHLDDGEGHGEVAAGHRRLGGGGENSSNGTVAEEEGYQSTFEARLAIFLCRTLIYIASMGQLIYVHVKKTYVDCKAGRIFKVGSATLPMYLLHWKDSVSLSLTLFLIVMFGLEPILLCFADDGPIFNEHCKAGEAILFPYSLLSAMALFSYFLLLIDFAVFSTRISAFVLVCGRLTSEVVLFLVALSFLILAFASAVSTLEQENPNFAGIPLSSLVLLKVSFGMMGSEQYDILHDYPALMALVILYVIATIVFLINILIAQLSCAYQSTYLDMLGYARLNRGKVISETIPSVPHSRWVNFVREMALDDRVEFGEGDLGISGGIQVLEPSNLNVTTIDMIRRFGGSTSQEAQWPEETSVGDEDDRLDRMEKMIEKAMKRMSRSSKAGQGGGQGGGGGSGSVGKVSGSGGGSSHASSDQSAVGEESVFE